MVVDQEKLAKLQAASRIGGKGTPRRKGVRKPKGAAVGGDDKKLQTALKKLNVQPVTGVEEVNMFREDGNVIHFPRASVHGIGSANTHAVYGNGVDKELTDLMPGILSQIGPDSLASLKKLAESYQAMGMGGMGGLPGMGGMQGAGAGAGAETADDEVPDNVVNFDAGDDNGDTPVDTNVDALD